MSTLNTQQLTFAKQFLNPRLQALYFLKNLPMALLAGVRLRVLNEEKSVATVPYSWRNKNPFSSMYFAVQSMAAELSTAAPAMLAMKGAEADIALIIVRNAATFSKKAKTKITFTCTGYPDFAHALGTLKKAGDSVEVTTSTTGTDLLGETVAVFEFTWAFKRKN
jgi:hypothetical protein